MSKQIYAERLACIQARIAKAQQQRPTNDAEIKLLAVSKTKPAHMVEAYYALGQRAFGENYVQDGIDKIQALEHLSDIEWHFIGPIQSNKTRAIAEHFDWVETVCRAKIAARLHEQRPPHLPPLNVLIQVNISCEPQKAGLLLEDVAAFAAELTQHKRLTLRGLMCIQSADHDEHLSEQFQAMQEAFAALKQQYTSVDTLSMGMSSDLEQAIAHASTQVRIGTDLFGPREK